MVTRGVLRIRFVFQEPSSVMISSLSPSGTPQTGVGFARPSLVKVVSSRYLALTTSPNAYDMGRYYFRFRNDASCITHATGLLTGSQLDRHVVLHSPAQLGENAE